MPIKIIHITRRESFILYKSMANWKMSICVHHKTTEELFDAFMNNTCKLLHCVIYTFLLDCSGICFINYSG